MSSDEVLHWIKQISSSPLQKPHPVQMAYETTFNHSKSTCNFKKWGNATWMNIWYSISSRRLLQLITMYNTRLNDKCSFGFIQHVSQCIAKVKKHLNLNHDILQSFYSIIPHTFSIHSKNWSYTLKDLQRARSTVVEFAELYPNHINHISPTLRQTNYIPYIHYAQS